MFFRSALLASVVCLSSCKDFFNDLNENQDLLAPQIVITPLGAGLLADGSTVSLLNISVTSAREIPADRRKITVSTTIGDLMIDGTAKKTAEVLLDQAGKKSVMIRHPLSVSQGTITVTLANGTTQASPANFAAAYPEAVVIDTPLTVLTDTATLNVTTIFSRVKGNVSVGLTIIFELVNNDSNEVGNAFFHSVTKSDSSGRSKGVLKLEKPMAGEYKVRVGYKKEDGTIQYIKTMRTLTIVASKI